jgi:hypothetical protein
MRPRRWAAWGLAALILASPAGAAPRRSAPSLNPVNAKLMKLKPADRAAELARVVGHWCIGTEAFPMGVVASGPSAGYAYWSLRCADGGAWAVQIDPHGESVAIDCAHFDANALGQQCFKPI